MDTSIKTNEATPKRRKDDITLQLIADNMQAVHDDVSNLRDDMKESLKDISVAITKLVQLEERQAHSNLVMQRFDKDLDEARKDIKTLDDRVTAVEIAMPELKRTSSWIFSAVLAVLSAAGMFAGKMLGIY